MSPFPAVPLLWVTTDLARMCSNLILLYTCISATKAGLALQALGGNITQRESQWLLPMFLHRLCGMGLWACAKPGIAEGCSRRADEGEMCCRILCDKTRGWNLVWASKQSVLQCWSGVYTWPAARLEMLGTGMDEFSPRSDFEWDEHYDHSSVNTRGHSCLTPQWFAAHGNF